MGLGASKAREYSLARQGLHAHLPLIPAGAPWSTRSQGLETKACTLARPHEWQGDSSFFALWR